jgi:small lipoprotein (TIGR04452 family)
MRLIQTGLLLLLLSRCALTSASGIAPLDSTSGLQAREKLHLAITGAFFTGMLAFCTDLSFYENYRCLDDIGTPGFYGALAASIFIKNSSNIKQNEFYTSQSINRCLRTVSVETTLLTDYYLKGQVSCNSSTKNCSMPPDALLDAALLPFLRSESSCQPVPAGKLISYYELNI